MFGNTFSRIFGSRNDRLIKKFSKIVKQINGFESQLQTLSDAELAAKTPELKKRLKNASSVQDILPEAFAVVREASRRTLGLRHFDVQMIGGMVLHEGKIAEMRTGEGKTLVATLPVYLNALDGYSVHIVTVNDYLARRDAQWMGAIYEFLGISVGVVVPNMPALEKQAAYSCDVVYGTNNEFGFDYLRDNMAFTGEMRAQGELRYAIVDEVDSILIDEARTPLIISGAAEDSGATYSQMNAIVPRLKQQQEEDGPGDFTVDEKTRQVYLTDEGHENAEKLLKSAGLLAPDSSLYEFSSVGMVHHLNAALRANTLFTRDVDYIIHEQKVVIIDEFTGRMQPGRRWSDGLHQAVEAKEGLQVQRENQTLASITFQNYFRLYDRLAGMTGTADTEAEEFQQIYGLEVVVIPTHMPMVRQEKPDLVYRSSTEKFRAIVKGIQDCQDRQQPVLVGTASIETSEKLSRLLRKSKVRHEVLNAKHHEREAKIIAQAGRPGAVTIATNMAGRGTDIVLGGNLEMELEGASKSSSENIDAITNDWQKRHDLVVGAGGLHVLSTERHESRRVDNQLRGRSGRQGDPGSSQFYLSLEDNLLRIFASEKVSSLMGKLGLEEDEAIEHSWVTKAIENAQKKVEGRNFDIRKQLLEFDDVANEQRKVVYEQRNALMDTTDIQDLIEQIRIELVESLVATYIPSEADSELWNPDGLAREIDRRFGLQIDISEWIDANPDLSQESVAHRVNEAIYSHYQEKIEEYGEPAMRAVEKSLMLMVLDSNWKEHLANMDFLRQGIHLRGYAQKNPKQEYKREAFEMFSEMLQTVRNDSVSLISRVQLARNQDAQAIQATRQKRSEATFNHLHPEAPTIAQKTSALTNPTQRAPMNRAASKKAARRKAAQPTVKQVIRQGRKIGRNEPCPCGSGRKYKVCCYGKAA